LKRFNGVFECLDPRFVHLLERVQLELGRRTLLLQVEGSADNLVDDLLTSRGSCVVCLLAGFFQVREVPAEVEGKDFQVVEPGLGGVELLDQVLVGFDQTFVGSYEFLVHDCQLCDLVLKAKQISVKLMVTHE